MSQVLLDTNALAMILTDDPRLPQTARATIMAGHSVGVSAISFYEIGQKVRLGKWDAMAPFVSDLVDIVTDAGLALLPLTAAQATKASLLSWDHRDPFDRMIAAASMIEGALLVSSDVAFDDLEQIERIWA